MEEQVQDEAFDALLRDEMVYIDDAGFTARVVKQLPMRQTRRSFRAVILIGVALLASALAYTLSDGGRFINVAIVKLSLTPLPLIYLSAIGAGILVMVLGTLGAISKTGGQGLR